MGSWGKGRAGGLGRMDGALARKKGFSPPSIVWNRWNLLKRVPISTTSLRCHFDFMKHRFILQYYARVIIFLPVVGYILTKAVVGYTGKLV
jgi:hypothetical protein